MLKTGVSFEVLTGGICETVQTVSVKFNYKSEKDVISKTDPGYCRDE